MTADESNGPEAPPSLHDFLVATEPIDGDYPIDLLAVLSLNPNWTREIREQVEKIIRDSGATTMHRSTTYYSLKTGGDVVAVIGPNDYRDDPGSLRGERRRKRYVE